MRVLIHGEARPQLARARNHWTGYRLPLFGLSIGLLDRAHDERADGDAGGQGALFQLLVQRFWKLDNGSGWHELIMTQVRIEGASEQVSIAISLPSGVETQDRPRPRSHQHHQLTIRF